MKNEVKRRLILIRLFYILVYLISNSYINLINLGDKSYAFMHYFKRTRLVQPTETACLLHLSLRQMLSLSVSLMLFITCLSLYPGISVLSYS